MDPLTGIFRESFLQSKRVCNMADAEGEIQLVDGDGADTNPTEDAEEELHKQRVTWVKAVLGELLCTTLFLFIVMAAGVSFARSQELRRVEATNPVVAAISTGFCAVALIYSFADVSGAHFNVRCLFVFCFSLLRYSSCLCRWSISLFETHLLNKSILA